MPSNLCSGIVPNFPAPSCSPAMPTMFELYRNGKSFIVKDRFGREVTDQFNIKEFTDGSVELTFKNTDLPESCK